MRERLMTTLVALLALSVTASAVAQASSPGNQPESAVTVFAAASLTDSVKDLAQRYERETGLRLRLSFAASSTLARQIENGAPADLFLSADEEWMRYLDERQLVARGTWVHPIANRLVLIAPADRFADVDFGKPSSVSSALGDGRLAVGDPAHVPVGRYAKQALEHYDLWRLAEPRLARAENVRAALVLVERGEAPLGIVYSTDARASDRVRVLAQFPPESHEPIRYSFAAIARRDDLETRAVLDYLTSSAAMETYAKYGFNTR
jgi:molybdate transport system substrate-binding protein